MWIGLIVDSNNPVEDYKEQKQQWQTWSEQMLDQLNYSFSLVVPTSNQLYRIFACIDQSFLDSKENNDEKRIKDHSK